METKSLRIIILVPFLFAFCTSNPVMENTKDAQASSIFNVKDYGAVGDGVSDDTPAINKAIEACDSSGGGTVLLDEGTYLTSSVHLASNVTIDIEAGATVKSKTDGYDLWEDNPFDEGKMDAAYYHVHASMFWGENLENVKLTGEGTIDAGGLTKSSKVKPGQGDKVIALKNCRNIDISKLSFIYNGGGGAHYVILLTGCDSASIDGVNLRAQRDGIDIMNSSNVTITNTFINSIRYDGSQEKGGDDAIKIGSDYSLGEIRECSNITVRNCIISAGCNGLMIGTETLGPIRDCTFENVEINFAGKNGIGITSNDGSVVSGLIYRNVSMKKVLSPFFIKVSDVKRVPSGQTYTTGKISDVTFENVTATDISNPINGEMANAIWGKPNSAIENIRFDNVSIIVKGGQELSAAGTEPPENDERFPQKLIEDVLHAPLPAFGYYISHVKNIVFNNCTLGFEKNDDRPAFILDDGSGIGLDGVAMQKGKGAECLVEVRDTVSDFVIHSCPGLPEINETVSEKKF